MTQAKPDEYGCVKDFGVAAGGNITAILRTESLNFALTAEHLAFLESRQQEVKQNSQRKHNVEQRLAVKEKLLTQIVN